jgi:predicted metalloprotease
MPRPKKSAVAVASSTVSTTATTMATPIIDTAIDSVALPIQDQLADFESIDVNLAATKNDVERQNLQSQALQSESQSQPPQTEQQQQDIVYSLTVAQNKRLWKSIFLRIRQQDATFQNPKLKHFTKPIVGSSPLLDPTTATTNAVELSQVSQVLQKKTLEDFAVDYFIHRHNQRHATEPDKHLTRCIE